MLLKRIMGVFVCACCLAASGSQSPTPIVTPQLLDGLKKKLSEGQVSVEPGPGEGCTTLAEQIQFLEHQITQPNKIEIAPTKIAPILPSGNPPLVQTPQQPQVHIPLASQAPVTPQEIETCKARIAGLEARVALLEQKCAGQGMPPASTPQISPLSTQAPDAPR